MAVPAGWIDLGAVGYTDKGNYNPTTTYNKLNVVKYKGSSWVCNLDNTIGKEPTDGIYWHTMMEGVAVATTEKTGTVMPDGETILVDKDGKVSVPTATETAFGLVKPDGETITIKDGVLSGQSKVAIATTEAVGTVKPDGTTIKIADDGTISAESTDLTGYATTEALAKKGDTLSYADSTLKLLSGETVLSEVTIEGGAASIQVKVTFDEAFKGAEYSITGGSESYSGTVPDSLVVIQKVKSYNTTYTVKSTANSQEYTSTVATGQYAGEYATVLNTFTATIQVTVTASAAAASGATVKAKSGANEYTATTNASGVAEVKVHNTGEYSITATYGDYNEGTGDSVTISTDGESVSSSVALFGAVLKVTADISSATATDASKVTVSDGTHNFEKTITATSTFSFTIYNAGTYKINMTNGTDTAAEVSVDVLEDGTTASTSISYFKATLNVKVINGNGATVTATDGAGHTYTGTATSGTVALAVYAAGTYTVSSKLNGTAGYTTKKVKITTNGGSYTATVLQSGATFSAGSDEVIGAMIDAAQDGDLDLKTLWAVGDTRTITVSAFAGVYTASHPSQQIDIVITSFEDYNGAGAVMQFDMKDGLAEYEHMHSSNIGTYTATDMYKTVLPNYANALPSWLKTRLKPFSVKVSPDGSNTTPTTVTNNKLAFRSEWEVFGEKKWAVAGQAEASGGKQISYYATQANRIKKQGHTGSAWNWWLRSPNSTKSFCICDPNGNPTWGNAAGTTLVAPFGCV